MVEKAFLRRNREYTSLLYKILRAVTKRVTTHYDNNNVERKKYSTDWFPVVEAFRQSCYYSGV